MRRTLAVLTSLSLSLSISCADEAGGDEPLDPADEAFGGPKADGFCVEEGTIEAIAILQAINDPAITVDDLDRAASSGGAGLNRTAAENIVAARPIESLTALDAVKNVGLDTCTKLMDFACGRGLCEAPPAACEVGNAADRDFDLVALEDPIAELVLKADNDCPKDPAELMAKLRRTDSAGCDGDARDGIETAVVSEEAQVTGAFAASRTVTTRTCGDRQQHEIFFSMFGGSPSALPDGVEVMALDRKAGVYNYYTLENGAWEFHGNSIDLVTIGTQRCAQCHTGGGPIMKELDSPWLHWEGHFDTPGASDLVDAHDDLGTQTDGITVEFLVRQGNQAWNDARLRHMKDNGSVADLLKPLFCTVEINLDNGADFFSPATGAVGEGDDMRGVPADFLLDTRFRIFEDVSVGAEIYAQAIRDAGQTLRGNNGQQLRDKDGNPAIDTIFDFIFPERAAADSSFVELLESDGIIDEDFVHDVLVIDFTRPIFSDDRCDLLQFAPDLEPADRTPDKIRQGFIDNLSGQSATSAAGQLLANLQEPGDTATHKSSVQAWFKACQDRDPAAFMADAMKIVSQRRKIATKHEVFEFPATMPQDTLSVPETARFNAETCVVE